MKTFNTSREILASPDQVFAAFNSDGLARWWGPAGFTNTFHLCEVKTGGRWSLIMHGPDGNNYPNEYLLTEVIPSRKIVIEHSQEPKFSLSIELTASEKGTHLSWAQTFENSDVAKRVEHIVVPANEQNLDKLVAEVAKSKLVPWGALEKANWFKEQTIKRSYKEEVVAKIEKLKTSFEVIQYGALSLDPNRYPVFLIKTKNFDKNKKTVLITGGVHGYETSGVHGAISFMETEAQKYTAKFNIVCAPCISPWAYETINRWNNLAIDPNRSFYPESPAEECKLFLLAIDALGVKIFAHFDLHETTDTDNSVFRPALEKRDARPQEFSEIPDGFYLVGDTSRPQKEFQDAIIAEVKKVTHIAPSDKDGNIIGVPLDSEGVIYYDMKKLFLCGGFSEAEYTTTTEVYPDSPKATDAICIEAQVASIRGGLNYL